MTLSRHRPSFSLARLRLADAVAEIGPDDLRFRSWEVDRLFRELYARPLPPDEVAELERRTGGWVAALQLFNLATARLPAFERRAAIAHVGRRVGPDWDFLAENVLAGLSTELQRFLLDTVPFERMTAELCDDLREASDSAHHLGELDRLQLVTSSMEEHGSFRPHEVLRAHVEAMVREAEGADALHKRYRRAAEALEHRGRFAEALLSYCRAEDWLAVSRLLGARGAEVAARPGSWLLGMPASIVQADPWLVLAVARQQRGDGRIVDAIATFERVERSALTAAPAVVAQRERLLLASLVDRSSRPSLPWVGVLREAVVGDPVAAAASLVPARSPRSPRGRRRPPPRRRRPCRHRQPRASARSGRGVADRGPGRSDRPARRRAPRRHRRDRRRRMTSNGKRRPRTCRSSPASLVPRPGWRPDPSS